MGKRDTELEKGTVDSTAPTLDVVCTAIDARCVSSDGG